MSKERSSRKEAMKKPAMSLKEKRAAKKAKKDNRPTFLGSEKK
jgi:hypothetical protein